MYTDIEVCIPDIEVCIPDIEVCIPDIEVCIPDIEVCIPDIEMCIPDIEMCIPDIEVCIPDYSLSDHYHVAFTWKCQISCSKNQRQKFIHYRYVKSFHEDNFLEDLLCQPWA